MENTNITYTPKAYIRKPAPEFKGVAWDNGKFNKLQLSNYKGQWVVLFFYPFDFTFVCPTEIVDFNDNVKEFQQLSKQVFNSFRCPSRWLLS